MKLEKILNALLCLLLGASLMIPTNAEVAEDGVQLMETRTRDTVKVTLDYNGGQARNGETEKLYEIALGEEISDIGYESPRNEYLSPTRNGYEMLGWSTEKNGEVIWKNDDYSPSRSIDYYKPKQDVRLYAIWGEYIEITLDYQGGTSWNGESEYTMKTVANEVVRRDWSYPQIEGKALVGWSDSPNGDIKYKPIDECVFDKSTRLYAQYTDSVKVTLITAGNMIHGNYSVRESNDYDPPGDEQVAYVPKGYESLLYAVAYASPKGVYVDEGYENKRFVGWSYSPDGNVDLKPSDMGRHVFTEDTTLYAVWIDVGDSSDPLGMVSGAKEYDGPEDIYVKKGEKMAFVPKFKPSGKSMSSIEWKTEDASISYVAQPWDFWIVFTFYDDDVYEIVGRTVGETKVTMTWLCIDNGEYVSKTHEINVHVYDGERPDVCSVFGFCAYNGKKYWYEDGEKQGVYGDPKNIWDTVYGKIERGREIYDPESDGWYWLDAVYDGAVAYGKEVWMPYIYQQEDECSDEVKWVAAQASDKGMEQFVYDAMINKTGKWVRYDENGRMLKGWVTIEGDLAEAYPDQVGNTYYYDTMTGVMAKGYLVVDGEMCHFDELTGVLK